MPGSGLGAGGESTDIVSPSDFAHLAVRVGDLNEALAFYDTVLRCRPHHVARAPAETGKPARGGAWCSYDIASRSLGEAANLCPKPACSAGIASPSASLVRILLVEDRTLERGAGDQGYDHFAFEYRTMDELVVRTYAQLKESGVKPYWCTNHGMTTSIYYADPDGNRVETQVDNFPTKAEGLAYIRGPDFARNPVGIDFDPDEMVDKVRGGASYEEMHSRVEGPRNTRTPRPVKGVHF